MSKVRRVRCPVNGRDFWTTRSDKIYCSERCRRLAEQRRRAGEDIADPSWYRGPFGDGPPRPMRIPEPVDDSFIDAEAYRRLLFQDDDAE